MPIALQTPDQKCVRMKQTNQTPHASVQILIISVCNQLEWPYSLLCCKAGLGGAVADCRLAATTLQDFEHTWTLPHKMAVHEEIISVWNWQHTPPEQVLTWSTMVWGVWCVPKMPNDPGLHHRKCVQEINSYPSLHEYALFFLLLVLHLSRVKPIEIKKSFPWKGDLAIMCPQVKHLVFQLIFCEIVLVIPSLASPSGESGFSKQPIMTDPGPHPRQVDPCVKLSKQQVCV